MAVLTPGDKAPQFRLPDQDGNDFVLKESLQRNPGALHLIYFYPKADTPGCTTQACGLRDAAPKIGKGAVVVGISPDKPAAQAKFDTKYGLGFRLLSDPDHTVAETYGVWGERSMYGRKFMGIIRSAFLVDAKGKIAQAWYKVPPKDTAAHLLAALDAA